MRRQAGMKIINPLSLAISRAPKKKDKKGGGSASTADVHDHVVNIFKDRDDPIILPSEYYPPWLLDWLEKKYSYLEIVKQVGFGVRVPAGKEQWSFMHSLKRHRIKHPFDHHKVYDSDDESREGDDHDLDEFVKLQMDEEKEETGEIDGIPGQAAEGGKEGEKKDGKGDAAAGKDGKEGAGAKDASAADAAKGGAKGEGGKGGAAKGGADAAKAPPKK